MALQECFQSEAEAADGLLNLGFAELDEFCSLSLIINLTIQ